MYIVPENHIAMVDVHVISGGEGRSRASVTYRMTSLSPETDDFVRAFGEAFEDFTADWSPAIQSHILDGVPLGGE